MPTIERSGLWFDMATAAGLVGPDGGVGETIFGQMTALAVRHGAVNLGQGAPGASPPDFLIQANADAMAAGANQYPPGQGQPQLLEAIAAQRRADYGQPVSPEQVLVTLGATEALTASVLALVPRGGVVVTFEPFYDSYAAAIALAGARHVTVALLPDGQGGFTPDWDAFEKAVAGADAFILNSPHNPTGYVFSPDDLLAIHDAASRHDFWVITDEVYESLVFGGEQHVPIAALVPDSDRIVSISSAGKTFNVTGWKVGWAIAPVAVRTAIQTVKQFLTFASSGQSQLAIAQALGDDQGFCAQNRDALDQQARTLHSALCSVPGLRVSRPRSGYFVLADFAELSPADAFTLNERITAEFGFTGVPVAALCAAGSDTAAAYRSAIRYSFCKSADDVNLAAERIAELARSGL